MAEQQQSPSGFKRMSLDKIIEAMTSDLENSNGHYVQFGVNPQQTTSHNWGNYSSNQTRHYIAGQSCHSNPPTMQSMPPMGAPLYMQDMSNYDSPTDSIYFPSQAVNHLGINENNDLIGTIDVGRGNYINVIYGNASQIMAEQCQLSNMTSYRNQNIIDREYGLFNDRHMNVPSELPTQNFNGKQLIENLVGNWAPNQSGTYSPFGGSPNVTPVLQPNIDIRDPEELPRNSTDFQHKKPRMVAEVKPMRPSYSDVLTKSAPTPPSPLTVQSIKPKTESVNKKVSNKNSKNKSKSTTLKRQNSSGSDDHNSPKIQIPRKVLEKNNSNLPRRWVSLDNLGSPTEVHEINSFDRSNQFEKKKVSKISKKAEKGETLNNSKVQNNNPKSTGNIPKRPIQINNNLNIINTSSETIHPEKVGKNQRVVNKVNKEETRVIEEKDSKHFQTEETQVQRARANQMSEKRESPVEDMYIYLNKYASHWIIIGLKILYWLLHLVFDVGNMMSVDLMNPPGKYRWYHTILYPKYFWVNIATAFSKICILNAIGKQLDNWIGVSKLGFWRKIKTKIRKGKKIVTNYYVSKYMLVLKPILQSLSETIIEEDVKPTYADYLRDLFYKINTVQQMARENLIKSKLGSKEYYDQRINPQNCKIGDSIYLLKEPSKGKFSGQYTGPHKVLEILQNQNVKIEVKEIPRTVHLNKLKLAHNRNKQ